MKKWIMVTLIAILSVIILFVLGAYTFCSLLSEGSCFNSPLPVEKLNAEPFPNCPDTLEPVCGVGNITFRNRCDARWVPIEYEGWCKGAKPQGITP